MTSAPVSIPVQARESSGPRTRVSRSPVTGGVDDTLSLEETLLVYGQMNKEGWEPRPGRYYASGLVSCFRKSYMKEMNRRAAAKAKAEGKVVVDVVTDPETQVALPYPVDKDENGDEKEFTTGLAEPGNALEAHFLKMWRRIYGYEGTVIQDMRLTKELVLQRDEQGQPTETIALVSKTDPAILGDNLEVLELNEFKSLKYQFPKKLAGLVAALKSREIPLSMVGVDTPMERTGVGLNNAVQVAVEAKILTETGRQPRKVKLHYVFNSDYDQHATVLLTPAEVDVLYEVGEWWAVEHHENLKKEKPPAPQFFATYSSGPECNYCPLRTACDKAAGGKRTIHPVMGTINERLQKAAKA